MTSASGFDLVMGLVAAAALALVIYLFVARGRLHALERDKNSDGDATADADEVAASIQTAIENLRRAVEKNADRQQS